MDQTSGHYTGQSRGPDRLRNIAPLLLQKRKGTENDGLTGMNKGMMVVSGSPEESTKNDSISGNVNEIGGSALCAEEDYDVQRGKSEVVREKELGDKSLRNCDKIRTDFDSVEIGKVMEDLEEDYNDTSEKNEGGEVVVERDVDMRAEGTKSMGEEKGTNTTECVASQTCEKKQSLMTTGDTEQGKHGKKDMNTAEDDSGKEARDKNQKHEKGNRLMPKKDIKEKERMVEAGSNVSINCAESTIHGQAERTGLRTKDAEGGEERGRCKGEVGEIDDTCFNGRESVTKTGNGVHAAVDESCKVEEKKQAIEDSGRSINLNERKGKRLSLKWLWKIVLILLLVPCLPVAGAVSAWDLEYCQDLPPQCLDKIKELGFPVGLNEKQIYDQLNEACCGNFPGDFHYQKDSDQNGQFITACLPIKIVPQTFIMQLICNSSGPFMLISKDKGGDYWAATDRPSNEVVYPYSTDEKSTCDRFGEEMLHKGDNGKDNVCTCRPGFKPNSESCLSGFSYNDHCRCEQIKESIIKPDSTERSKENSKYTTMSEETTSPSLAPNTTSDDESNKSEVTLTGSQIAWIANCAILLIVIAVVLLIHYREKIKLCARCNVSPKDNNMQMNDWTQTDYEPVRNRPETVTEV